MDKFLVGLLIMIVFLISFVIMSKIVGVVVNFLCDRYNVHFTMLDEDSDILTGCAFILVLACTVALLFMCFALGDIFTREVL